ncbi:MAG: PAS domain S-box protein [FCB group bacterium]|nr:PAS domain S-box protein [FCB group bacterium]
MTNTTTENNPHLVELNEKLQNEINDRIKIEKELKRKNRELELILKTSRYINSSLDLNEVFQRIAIAIMDHLNSYGCTIYLLSEDGKKLFPQFVIDPVYEKEIMATPLDISSSFTGKVVKAKVSMMFNDAGLNKNGFQIPGTSEEAEERIIAAPFIFNDEVLGAICLNRIGPYFSKNDLNLLDTFANYVTTTVKNAQNYHNFQHEILERTSAEKAKEESEKQFMDLRSNVPVGLFRATSKGEFLSVNPAMVSMFGFDSEQEFLSTSANKLFIDVETRNKLISILEKENNVRNFEINLQKKNGDNLWCLLNVNTVCDDSGKWIYQDGIVTDVSREKLTEKNLAKTQFRLAIILDNVPNIILYETGGSKEFVSTNIYEMLGYPAKDFINDKDKFSTLIHPDDKKYIHQKYLDWEKSGKQGMLTSWFRVKKADDTYIWIEDRMLEITGKDNIKYHAGVNIDITNLKNAEEQLKESYGTLQRILEETVEGLVQTVEMRDPYTAGHQRRVSDLASAIALEMGFPEEEINGIKLAALVHDIGKINIPAEILSKPGKLSTTEFNLIKMHPQTGHDILKSIEFPWPIATIVLQHQERYDGSSYPNGLKGEEILIKARILAVADVIEAMSSHRPYRPSLGIDFALEEIEKNRDILYDPEVSDICLNLFREKGYKFPKAPADIN